ncbi:MAG: hypothetical protein ABFD18_04770 [Syntrophomonas sp.]
MKEIRNCPRCNRLFSYSERHRVCPECANLVEEEYSIIRRFIRDNPGVNVIDVVKQTGIKQAAVLKFMREGRFVCS